MKIRPSEKREVGYEKRFGARVVSITAMIIFAAISSVSFTGCAANLPPPEQKITEADNGRTFTCRIGQKITVKIPDPATGGYNIITPVFNPKVLKLLTKRDLPPEPAPVPKLGDFGSIIYELEVIGAGKTDLAIQIARNWEEVSKRPEEYLKVKIVALE
jgi:predicted secreted protein